jgi:imidazolonepropionase-like amidohydrolase
MQALTVSVLLSLSPIFPPLIVVLVSQVKLSMSGDEILEDLRAEDTTFSDELVAAGVEAAHAKGIRVCSHARSDKAVRQCLQYGIDILYHGCTSSFFSTGPCH